MRVEAIDALSTWTKPSVLDRVDGRFRGEITRDVPIMDVSEAGDWSEVRVRLPLNWRSRNYVGTIFGGSMYGAIDPIFMIMLIKLLGPGYTVWDKEAKIRFRKPGRETLHATFRITEEELELIRSEVRANGKTERTYSVDLVNRDGVVCAVAFTGDDRGDQWPGSRVISAQKANTANAFSLPALALSTVGVVLTAALLGAFAALVLGFPWRYGLLFGAIVGSTDAAAVFSLLRHSGVHLNERVSATLEIESGSNDPMAIFLTIALVELIQGGEGGMLGVAGTLVQQFGVGAIGGAVLGLALREAVQRIRLAEGLYALFIASGAAILSGV